jgi:hypothetical protein
MKQQMESREMQLQVSAVQLPETPISLTPNIGPHPKTLDCALLLIGFQCGFPRRRVVRIFQREKKPLQAVFAFPQAAPVLPGSHARLPFQGRKAAKDTPARVQNECQCVRAAFASAVKVSRATEAQTPSRGIRRRTAERTRRFASRDGEAAPAQRLSLTFFDSEQSINNWGNDKRTFLYCPHFSIDRLFLV